jgi:hypothetical protein
MRGRHRLTVHADLLPQAPCNARLGVSELDALGANPAVPTDDPALPIDERHGMRLKGANINMRRFGGVGRLL